MREFLEKRNAEGPLAVCPLLGHESQALSLHMDQLNEAHAYQAYRDDMARHQDIVREQEIARQNEMARIHAQNAMFVPAQFSTPHAMVPTIHQGHHTNGQFALSSVPPGFQAVNSGNYQTWTEPRAGGPQTSFGNQYTQDSPYSRGHVVQNQSPQIVQNRTLPRSWIPNNLFYGQRKFPRNHYNNKNDPPAVPYTNHQTMGNKLGSDMQSHSSSASEGLMDSTVQSQNLPISNQDTGSNSGSSNTAELL